ncbi:MAG: DUF4129 domain-containing protein [Balneolales bacterium]|nr:DUF4129 domain-containing protein [Balneolales bacterium]
MTHPKDIFPQPADTSGVSHHLFEGVDEQALAQFRESVSYAAGEPATTSFIQRILEYIFGLLASVSPSGPLADILLLGIVVLAIGLVIFLLFRSFRPNLRIKDDAIIAGGTKNGTEWKQGWKSPDPDALYSSSDYRAAVRLLMLDVLFQLEKQNFLVLKPGKSAAAYQNDLNDPELITPFSRLSRLYQYGWYGGFSISKAQLDDAVSAWKRLISAGTKSRQVPETQVDTDSNQNNGS